VSAFSKLYERLLAGLAIVSALAFGAVSFFIAYEVSARWLGFRPPVWPQAVSEFTMLYATVLAAPWILRRSEHVQVTTLVAMFAPNARVWLARAMSLLGMLVCLVIGWYSLQVMLHAQGLEIRSFEMPKWVVYAPLPVGFFLLAGEFFRHMLGGTLFAGEELEYYSKRREA
jgi:TRAP-type C4-dicarboxylate transport system permease small subunit